MLRAVAFLVFLASCDALFSIDHVSTVDAHKTDDGPSRDGPPGTGPQYVQGTSTAVSNAMQATVTYTSVETAGDLNVVFVSWVGGVSIATVGDDRGNAYASCAGTVTSAMSNQDCWYAQNVSAGVARITVTFNAMPFSATVRALEYNDIATTGALVTANGITQTSMQMLSGPLSVSANDLIVAGFVTSSSVVTPGPGFTERAHPSLTYLEDMVAPGTDSYAALATQGTNGLFIVHAAAFRHR